MSFLEDLFEGRRHGQRGGYDHHDDHGSGDYYRPRGPQPNYEPDPRAPQTACGQCRAPVAVLPGFRFCPYCGGPLTATPTCPGCGAARVAGAAFCAGCGAKL